MACRAGVIILVLAPMSRILSVEMRPTMGGTRPRTPRRDSRNQDRLLPWLTLASRYLWFCLPGFALAIPLSPDPAAPPQSQCPLLEEAEEAAASLLHALTSLSLIFSSFLSCLCLSL